MHAERIKKLLALMEKYGLEACLVTFPIDIFYLTGMQVSLGRLIVSKSPCFLTDHRYLEVCQKDCIIPVVLFSDSAFSDACNGIKELAVDRGHTTLDEFFHLEKMGAAILPVKSLVQELRVIKDDAEIHLMREAARLGSEGMNLAASLLKEGVSESEIALEVDFFWRKKGAQGLAFDPIVAFGANGSMPHYRAAACSLKPNQSALVDIGTKYQNYNSDMTRVLFSGKADREILKIYDIVKEASAQVLEAVRPGALIGDLDQIARSYIDAKGYAGRFTHSLGHGIGLEVHEFPTIKQGAAYSSQPLQKGMVITIEPGIYLPGVGGVRYENTIVVTEESYENLTLPALAQDLR